jgi:hypothetical protein
MAQLAQPLSNAIPATVRTHRVMWGAVLALLVAGAVVLALTLPGDDSSSGTAPAQPSVVSQDARFDGGPNEGTRGVVSPSPTTGIRFDGGPEEGTRGSSAVAAGVRFDGGPDEGTRGTR